MLLYQPSQASLYLILALYLQQGRGLGPVASGLVFGILAAGYLITLLPTPGLIHRFGRRVLMAAAIVLAAGFVVLSATLAGIGTGDSIIALLPGLFLIGLGQGFGLNSLVTLIVAGADPEHVASAAGVQATVQQVGSALGVAVIGVVFFGLVDHGLGAAFAVSAAILAGLMIIVGLLAGLLPASSSRAS
ncbi:MFS transporter [Microlunatus endophyticus]|nr:MFS transporter [Microlunatus endophyticus]